MKEIEDPDVENGKESGRQLVIGCIYAFIIGISWLACQMFQYACVWYATDNQDSASIWISSGYFMWNIILVAIITVFSIPLFIGYQGEDSVRVRMNTLMPQKTSQGSTKYVVYDSGLYFKDPLETEGFEAEIEHDLPCESDEFTTTVANKSIRMKLMLVWVPYSPRLSAFFQNGKTERDRQQTLQIIMTIAKQVAESEASKYSDVEEARKEQVEIADKVRVVIEDKAKEYGIFIKEVAFALCDYSTDVQSALDAAMKARAFTEIVKELIAAGVPSKDAVAQAGALSGNGTQIKHSSIDISVNPELSAAIAKGGPGLAAAIAAIVAAKGNQNSNPPNNPKKKGNKP